MMSENKDKKTPNKQYPIDDVTYEGLPEEKRIIIKKLLYLFVFYASKGSKHSYNELSQNYFMELVSEVWTAIGKQLVRGKIQWQDLSILYYTKGCKQPLSFKNFLQLLPTLAIYLQPDMNREDSLKSLMHHLMNVYEAKVLPQIDGKLINIEINIEENTRDFLSKLSSDLTKLYKLYFPREVTNKFKDKQFKALSFQCFMEFLKDFDVFPKIISARDIFYIFHEGCQSIPSELLYETEESKSIFSEQGEIFKLTKFVESLIVISKRVFPKLKQIQNEQQWENQQKYVLRTLLQYMQTVKTMNKKKTKFMHERFCFIVLDEHPEQEMMRTIQVKDKIIREPVSNVDFFSLMDRLKF